MFRLRCIRKKKSLWTSASAAGCFEPSFLFLDFSVSGASKAADLSDGALRSWSGSRATSVRGILPRPSVKIAALQSPPPPKCRRTTNGISTSNAAYASAAGLKGQLPQSPVRMARTSAPLLSRCSPWYTPGQWAFTKCVSPLPDPLLSWCCARSRKFETGISECVGMTGPEPVRRPRARTGALSVRTSDSHLRRTVIRTPSGARRERRSHLAPRRGGTHRRHLTEGCRWGGEGGKCRVDGKWVTGSAALSLFVLRRSA